MASKIPFGAASHSERTAMASTPQLILMRFCSVALLYYLAARLGLSIPYVGTHVSLVWLPTGVALAAIRRWGPGMVLATFVGAVGANATAGGPIWLAGAIGLGNSLAPLVSARLLSAWRFDDAFLRRRDMGVFLAAVVSGMTVSATGGTCWLFFAGLVDGAHWMGTWSTWWIGDSVGALLSGIPLLVFGREAWRRSFSGWSGLGNVAFQVIALGCGLSVFSRFIPAGSPGLFPLLALPFFLIPLLALRGGVFSSSLAVLLLALAAAYGTAQGYGPFAATGTHAGILALWSYITAQACTALLICGIATELQSSRRQFAAVVQHAHDAILIIGPYGEVVAVNPSAERLLGLDAVSVVGQPLASLPWGNGTALSRFIENAGTGAAEELTLTAKGGRVLSVESQAARYQDASGAWQTHVMLGDVSARKRAESLLAASEARLKAITDNLPAVIAYVDRDQTYRFANESFRRVMNVDPQSVIGLTMRQFLGDEAHAALTPEIVAALRGERRKFERTGWAHNATIHFLVEYIPEFDPQGDVAGFFVMVLDISQRRLAELALARSEQRIRTITDNLPAMISHFDPQLRYTFANAKVAEVFQRPLDSLVGLSVREVRGEEAYAVLQPQAALALAGRPVSFEISRIVEARTEHFEANLIPEFGPDGEVQGLYALTFDVTQRREVENRLRASVQLLDRTGALAGVGGWELELATNTVHWSQETRRIHEVDDDFVPTVEGAIAFYVGDGRATIERAVQNAIATGAPWNVELPLLTARGRPIWVRATGEMEFDGATAVRLFGAFQDVTDRVVRERRLREQSELLQVTLKSIRDAVITTDSEGRINWLNPVAERLTGWLASEAHGRPLPQVFHIVHEQTRLPAPDPVFRCLASGKTAGLAERTVLVSRDGAEYGIEDSAAPIRTEDGQVLGAVLVFHDVSEQRRLSGEMSYRATHDALTGLVNRAEFEVRLERLLKSSYEDGVEHALLYIDLDQFKLVNDACGHAAGDQLLQQVAKLLGDAVRARDTLARLGGDEFAILMEHCTAEQAQRVAEKICARMDEFRFIHDDQRFRIGTSIGLVPVDKRWTNTTAIKQAADTSCYAAKEAGRNRVHAWYDTDAAMKTRHAEMQWTTRIERALDEDHFTLFAQRIVGLNDRHGGLHAEVLLRMTEPDGTTIAPGAFLPAAERFHLASRIDRWVLRHVIYWMRSAGDIEEIELISVNLSGQSVGDRAFHRWATDLLAQAGARISSRLCLEITETAAVTNLADAALFIEQVRAIGVKFALDDFGAGASSFGYLKTLHVDVLKIDGQFIRDLVDDPLDEAAVRCFADVARVMKLKTVAEFVDRPEILARLKEMCIDYAQGFLLHRPAPIERLLEARLDVPVQR